MQFHFGDRFPNTNTASGRERQETEIKISYHWYWIVQRKFNSRILMIMVEKITTVNGNYVYCITLQWRHNGLDGFSNHQPHDCLLNRLFRCRSKKKSKLCVTGLCEGNSPGTGDFPAQMASNSENVSIWWRHHVLELFSTHSYIVLYFIQQKWVWSLTATDSATIVVPCRAIRLSIYRGQL